VACVVEPDPDTARGIAREYAERYLARRNYADNLRRLGFGDDELAGSGSDRLLDAVIPHGSAERIAEAVREHLDAGANHVCLQPLGPHPAEDYRALAAALL
jgi:alkanesulfonate monooxygenase SsuD/methylene tetrahydromethanopterin reductase-like flavin-dependent oxidoreductase (luciferase family)